MYSRFFSSFFNFFISCKAYLTYVDLFAQISQTKKSGTRKLSAAKTFFQLPQPHLLPADLSVEMLGPEPLPQNSFTGNGIVRNT
jgi:hypothetical protein